MKCLTVGTRTVHALCASVRASKVSSAGRLADICQVFCSFFTFFSQRGPSSQASSPQWQYVLQLPDLEPSVLV